MSGEKIAEKQSWWEDESQKCIGRSSRSFQPSYEDYRHHSWEPRAGLNLRIGQFLWDFLSTLGLNLPKTKSACASASLILLKNAFISPLPGSEHSPGSILPPASSLNCSAPSPALPPSPSLAPPSPDTHFSQNSPLLLPGLSVYTSLLPLALLSYLGRSCLLPLSRNDLPIHNVWLRLTSSRNTSFPVHIDLSLLKMSLQNPVYPRQCQSSVESSGLLLRGSRLEVPNAKSAGPGFTRLLPISTAPVCPSERPGQRYPAASVQIPPLLPSSCLT